MTDSTRAKLLALKSRLVIPAFVAPMFLVTNPEMVIACCRAGVVGGIPLLNARTLDVLDGWLAQIDREVGPGATHTGRPPAPWAANLIAHKSNTRIDDELQLVLKYRPEVVIIAWAKPGPIVDAIHDYGGLVFADVATVEHARKAADAGVDGLILVAAGAGGHTGDISPFTFVPAVREFHDGALVVGGGIVDGAGIRACEVLGADFANLGTRFIATTECPVDPRYKQMMIDASTRDVVVSAHFTGVRATYLMPSVLAAGVDPAVLSQPPPAPDVMRKLDAKAWKNIWSAGQGVFATKREQTTAELVADLTVQYRKAAGC